MSKLIDTWTDFHDDAGGRDPDGYSPTLQEYHRILWSKPLPNGKAFTLDKIRQNRLFHKSDIGEFVLSSDMAVPSFTRRKRMQHIISQISPEVRNDFYRLTSTIGASLIWPGNRIGNKMTINGARGFNSRISDRLDLTIECIRRYYQNQHSPLYSTFKMYDSFFRLFENFKGYIDFFLLQDIVTGNYAKVKIALDFDDFRTSASPRSPDEYLTYVENTSSFVKARNTRISLLF